MNKGKVDIIVQKDMSLDLYNRFQWIEDRLDGKIPLINPNQKKEKATAFV